MDEKHQDRELFIKQYTTLMKDLNIDLDGDIEEILKRIILDYSDLHQQLLDSKDLTILHLTYELIKNQKKFDDGIYKIDLIGY